MQSDLVALGDVVALDIGALARVEGMIDSDGDDTDDPVASVAYVGRVLNNCSQPWVSFSYAGIERVIRKNPRP